jgi:hypothetical protein
VLAGNKLTGMLDAAPWHYLPALRHVDLSYNSLGGRLPDAWGMLRAHGLTLLLTHNNLTGSLPESWGTPHGHDNTTLSLALLDVSHNAITGANACIFVCVCATACLPRISCALVVSQKCVVAVR